MTMEIEDDEDFYSPEPSEAPETTAATSTNPAGNSAENTVKKEEAESATPAPASNAEPKTELEEGEEEDEEGPMDEDDDDSVGPSVHLSTLSLNDHSDMCTNVLL